ncbi:hypothetical protein LK533_15060 [Sphingomonas sp. PL-96]|uniref:hypothetical protein n=1 Tax=Sphingomonas sp. PL-96 TaxID=2887201 RepID=UPI001E590D1A|nr:hypothetical protein [Sphingomonas sp. PL-96]MCC2977983.1 hypothetical protein [Sphingomonas sp. PL-96]
MRKMLKQINAAPLTVELMQAAMEAVADLPEERRSDFMARMMGVMAGKVSQEDHWAVSMAIHSCLLALARLIGSEQLDGFRLPAHADGPDLLHEDAVRTATEVPLHEDGDDLIFDAAEFREHLLAIASPAGSA